MGQMMSRAEVLRIMGWSPTTLWRALRRGAFPQPMRLPGCHPRWRAEDVEALLQR
ncbi:AlpA family transcriptional regulator [Trichlorobacter lovleyi]|uniref:helix-turn-helix transcriptional regulator n=1 Tax=Trichlorobacter lovleyi TaxID=313985 RepID=UPI002480B557|nr:hypothetical protein [Trichlorobacter lovleyi]